MKFASHARCSVRSSSPIALATPALAQENQAAAQTPQAEAQAENPTSRRSSSPAPAAPTAPSPTARSRSTSSAPRRIVNPGQTETNKILNQLVPSFNFPQPSIADGSDALRPATLRGLSPDQTLVLVNGKRRHVSALLNINGTVGRGSAAVDMNLIPRLAIEPGRGAARRRRRAIWLGRDRRRDQHPAQECRSWRPRRA